MVATQGADGMHLYLDGQQVASGPTTQRNRLHRVLAARDSGQPRLADRTTNFYSGSLSDAAFYSGTELTPAQVQTLFAAG